MDPHKSVYALLGSGICAPPQLEKM